MLYSTRHPICLIPLAVLMFYGLDDILAASFIAPLTYKSYHNPKLNAFMIDLLPGKYLTLWMVAVSIPFAIFFWMYKSFGLM